MKTLARQEYVLHASLRAFVLSDSSLPYVIASRVHDQAADLLRLLEDGDLRKKMGEAGRQRVATEFSKERFAAELSELYYEMLGRRLDSRAHAQAAFKNTGVIGNECR